MEILTFILIGGFFVAAIVYFKRRNTRQAEESVLRQIAEHGERIQATLPPLQPGALFTAAITPLPNNKIQFAIKLSPEAREIIRRENLNPVRILSYPNENYAKEKREQERLRQSPKLEDHIRASIEPEKTCDITIEKFARPSGITRSFPSASEAKAWAERLREGLQIFQNELEANQTPAEAEVFIVHRKS
jgi:hypothetical protein